MMSPLIQKIPRKVEEIFGLQGTDDFVDFLNTAFLSAREGMMDIVADRFERRLMEETGKIREEMSSFRAEWKTELADFRTQTRIEIASLKSELKADISEIHKTIAAQTRWMFAAMIGLTGIFSLIVKL